MADASYVVPPSDKTNYQRKLEILCQDAKAVHDPYKVPNEEWKDDLSLWPELEFGQIYTYLVETPGQFTKESLKAYKSLEAFNYYISGWVQTVYYWNIEDTGTCVLKGKVKPSQRLNDRPHEAWIAVEKRTGNILTAHCSCMAGCGEVCSHVAGILFKVEACIRLQIGARTCTSIPCVWNQTFSKKVEPSPLVNIYFKNPNHRRAESEASLARHKEDNKNRPVNCPPPRLNKADVFSHLYKASPESAVFTVVPVVDQSTTPAVPPVNQSTTLTVPPVPPVNQSTTPAVSPRSAVDQSTTPAVPPVNQSTTPAVPPRSAVNQSTMSAVSSQSAVNQSTTSTVSPRSAFNQLTTPAVSPRSAINQSTTPAVSPRSAVNQSTTPAVSPRSAINQSTTPAVSPQSASAVNQSTTPAVPRLPSLLTDVFEEKYRKYSETELSKVALEVFNHLSVTKEEADFLETSTRTQSASITWYNYRKGRITASVFSTVLKYTGKDYPKSIMTSIMQYREISEDIPSLKWGRDHEPIAAKEYSRKMYCSHTDFRFTSSGLVVDPKYPYLGATPDGKISCVCCGNGVIEIKCSYKYRNDLPTSSHALADHNYCLVKTASGQVILSRSHKYYHQVQGQIALCGVKYCDFICWTMKGIFIERIHENNSYLPDNIPSLQRFFLKYVLPELLSHNFYHQLTSVPDSNSVPVNSNGSANTSSPHQPTDTSVGDNEQFCICRRGEFGYMIACDNPLCETEWFHYSCVGLKRKPVGAWYCPNCKPLFKKRKKQ